jgi:glucose/arabinose dehydrogenase
MLKRILASCLLFAWSDLPGGETLAMRSSRGAEELYDRFCAACHGADMRGAKVSSLLDSHWRFGDSDEAILRSIRDGAASAGMPAFGPTMNDAELRSLVVYIRETARRTKEPTPKAAEPLPSEARPGELHTWRAELVVEAFDVPWSFDFLPDGRMLVTDRVGTLHLVDNGRVVPEPIRGIPRVWVRDEGGLMAVAVHPDYENERWIYLTLSDPGEGDTGNTKVVRGRLRDGAWVDEQTIFAAPRESYTDRGMNFGSRLAFHGPYLFFTFGERGEVGEAQDLSKPNGKVHRVFHDGRVPADNPFVQTPGAVPSIWSFGHRNPQGLTVDPSTGELWESEHGPRGGDELNRVLPGANYGWPVVTHGMNYDGRPISARTEGPGLEPPAWHWTPSIAVSPIHIYQGDAFPRWKNQLFVGSLAQQKLLRMSVAGGRVAHVELVFEKLGRIRDIKTGPDGLLYIALEIPGPHPGRIIRLRPAEENGGAGAGA